MRSTRREALALGLAGVAGCVGTPRHPEKRSTSNRSGDVHIGLVGDVMLGRGVTDRWIDADHEGVWGSTLDRLQSLDGLVANLECVISDGGERWPDKTYYFRADPEFARAALSAADTSVCALGNNHILDFGEEGLVDTMDHLDDIGVDHAGAGRNRHAAIEPAITEIGGLTVATISLTDRWEAFAAGPDTPGSAFTPLDPTVSETRAMVQSALIRAERHDPDLVVASLHWGPNWETTPTDHHEAFGRWLVDEGVDVVHGHSAHVLQGVELYRGSPIIYDAGDFVDDYVDMEDVYNKRSALFELHVDDGDLDALSIRPTRIVDRQARLADGDVAAWVRETIRDRSAPYGTTVDEDGIGARIALGTD